jgi:peptidyl-tRNA hydrolase
MHNEPILYILMRTDLESLNPGKGMAQACHAANQMVHTIETKGSKEFKENFSKWQLQAGSFGTTIVLDGGTENQIKNKIEFLRVSHNSEAMFGVTIDPEYPIRDGKVVHLIPHFMTCAWVFSPFGKLPALDDMKLHP